jgi:ribosomal protein L24E
MAAGRKGVSAKADDDELGAGVILVAFEKLFGGGRGVQRFARSGLRYVKLADGAVLVEQNPKKRSEWAHLAREGRRIAWVLRDGEYLARVVDGEVVMLD